MIKLVPILMIKNKHHPFPVFLVVRRLVSKLLTQMFEQRAFSCLALFEDWCKLPFSDDRRN